MLQTEKEVSRASRNGAMPVGTLAKSDPEIATLIDREVDRKRSGLELIAS